MKKGNKKGFTLIELLAVIIILGVLMLLAVPMVSENIESSRMKTFESTINTMVDSVRTDVVGMEDPDYQIGANEYLVVPFVCIGLEKGNNDKSPFGAYVPATTAVIVTHKDGASGYDYYVSAQDVSGYGMAFGSANDIDVSYLAADATLLKIEKDTAAAAGETKYKITSAGSEVGSATAKVVTCTAFNTAMGA